MKKRMTVLFASVLLIVALVVTGCAPESAPPDEEGAAPEEEEEEEEAPPAAPEEEVVKWRMQTIFSSGQPAYDLSQEFCDNVKVASNGRVEIGLYPNTAIVGSMEGYQACGEGVFEVHESWSGYAAGVEYALRPLSSQPMGLQGQDRLVWVYEAGGKELTEKAFNSINLHVLSFEAWPAEAAHGSKDVENYSDFKGLKFRTGDPRWGQKTGVDSLSLPLEDTFTGLQTGAVDVAEFGSLLYNEGIGLTDIADYVYWPDFWNVQTTATIVVNLDAWNKLAPDLQKIVEMCARANEVPYWTKYQWGSAVAYERLNEEGRITFIRIPPEDMAEIRAAMDEVELEDYEKSELTKEFYDSYWEFKKTYLPYREITKWWGECADLEEQLGRLADEMDLD